MLIMLHYNTFVNWACWVFFVSSAIYVAIPQYYFFFYIVKYYNVYGVLWGEGMSSSMYWYLQSAKKCLQSK